MPLQLSASRKWQRLAPAVINTHLATDFYIIDWSLFTGNASSSEVRGTFFCLVLTFLAGSHTATLPIPWDPHDISRAMSLKPHITMAHTAHRSNTTQLITEHHQGKRNSCYTAGNMHLYLCLYDLFILAVVYTRPQKITGTHKVNLFFVL